MVERSFSYQVGDVRLPVLAYLPERHHPVPAVLVVHGAGWTGGSPQGFRGPAEALARAGLAAFDVGYTLGTRLHPGFPGQVNDLVGAVEWIRDHARSLGVDPSRLGALGSSAGGNLVALLALDAGGPRLTSVVTWSAPEDLMTMRSGPAWLVGDLEADLGCTAEECPQRWRQAAPVDHIARTPTRWLIFNSRNEVVPASGAEAMASGLRRAGDAVRLILYPGHDHAGEYQAAALAPTVRFLRTSLGTG